MTDRFPNRWTKGKSTKKFQFTYQDYANLLGMTELAVRKAASRKQFDPNSLESIFEFHTRKSQPPQAPGPQATPLPPAPKSPPSAPEIAWSSNISNANPLSPEAERRVQQAREHVAKQREKAEFFSR